MLSRKAEEYALRISCADIVVLLPLSSIQKILSKMDEELQRETEDTIVYRGRTYPIFSMSELLHKNLEQEESYVILVQNEDIEAALYVSHVDEVYKLDNPMMTLPTYLQMLHGNYISGCCLLKDKRLAYAIDVGNLILYSLRQREDAYEVQGGLCSD